MIQKSNYFDSKHRRNVCNIFLGHGRRASTIHVVQQLRLYVVNTESCQVCEPELRKDHLSDYGIKTTPSPGVVPWISVQLKIINVYLIKIISLTMTYGTSDTEASKFGRNYQRKLPELQAHLLLQDSQSETEHLQVPRHP